MPDPDKRMLRELKRSIKKRGNKARRADLKRGLATNPEVAAEQDGAVTRYSSAAMNGHDRDATRRRDGDEAGESGE